VLRVPRRLRQDVVAGRGRPDCSHRALNPPPVIQAPRAPASLAASTAASASGHDTSKSSRSDDRRTAVAFGRIGCPADPAGAVDGAANRAHPRRAGAVVCRSPRTGTGSTWRSLPPGQRGRAAQERARAARLAATAGRDRVPEPERRLDLRRRCRVLGGCRRGTLGEIEVFTADLRHVRLVLGAGELARPGREALLHRREQRAGCRARAKRAGLDVVGGVVEFRHSYTSLRSPHWQRPHLTEGAASRMAPSVQQPHLHSVMGRMCEQCGRARATYREGASVGQELVHGADLSVVTGEAQLAQAPCVLDGAQQRVVVVGDVADEVARTAGVDDDGGHQRAAV
jgi:hypothetical protein